MSTVHFAAVSRGASFASALSLVAVLAACGHDAPPAADPSATSAASADAGVAAASTPTSASSASSASAASTASAASASSDGGAGIAVDQPAPDFDVTDQNGAHLALAQLQGHPVVLYFYPKDETPGCTKEACSFRDQWEQMAKSGVVLIGISADTDESHKKFAANHHLPFHLVSDPDGALGAKYGVPFTTHHARQTILIGPTGTIRRIYRNVTVDTHSQDIAAALAT